MEETNSSEQAQAQAQAKTRTRKRGKADPGARVTWEMIAERAYQISLSSEAGDEMDNWLRAERELLGRF